MAKGRAKPIKRKLFVMPPPSPYWRSPIRKWLLSYAKPNGERHRTTCTGTYEKAIRERDKALGLGEFKGQATTNFLDCWIIDTGEDVWRKNLADDDAVSEPELVPSTRAGRMHQQRLIDETEGME